MAGVSESANQLIFFFELLVFVFFFLRSLKNNEKEYLFRSQYTIFVLCMSARVSRFAIIIGAHWCPISFRCQSKWKTDPISQNLEFQKQKTQIMVLFVFDRSLFLLLFLVVFQSQFSFVLIIHGRKTEIKIWDGLTPRAYIYTPAQCCTSVSFI